MAALIAFLISLLGYGTPADFAEYSQAQLEHEIELAEQNNSDGGVGGDWDDPSIMD